MLSGLLVPPPPSTRWLSLIHISTTLTLNYFHAPSAPLSTSSFAGYSLLETITFTRQRNDGTSPVRPPVSTPQFSDPALVVAGTAALGAGALYLASRSQAVRSAMGGSDRPN